MHKSRGLAPKLIFLVLTSVSIIFALVLSYYYSYSRRIVTENVEKNARNLSAATVNRIDKVLRSIEKVPKNLADFLENSSYSGGELIELLRRIVSNNPELYGAAIAFEPYGYKKDVRCFAPYVYRTGNTTEFVFIPYEYFFWDWYQIPRELGQAVWSEPYYDEGAGNIIMTTFSAPFYRKDPGGGRRLMGVVTADVSISWLQKIVSSIRIEETGFGFLLSKNGTYVTHPRDPWIMHETIFSVAEARKDKYLRELGRAMIRGDSGFVPVESPLAGKCWMSYAPLPSNHWSLGVLFPKDELMADIARLNRIVLFLSLGGFLFILAVVVLISRSITRPLRELSAATREVAEGNLDVVVPAIRSRDEVGTLAESFDYMRRSLKEYIRELTETTAAKERIESELKIAREIQMGILHKIFPPFPERAEFDIYAMLEPAREVGGDLYDFFFVDEEHLCLSIGDVSGKGVPASLFMAITNTLTKTKASQGLRAEEILNTVNHDLSVDNPSLMFVTLFLGIFNIQTGELIYCNGGHNPPYVVRAGGSIEPLESTGGLALGVMEDFEYRSKKITLHRGDSLFLYTDGVTEAMDPQGALFSDERLRRELRTLKNASLKDVVTAITDKVKTFAGEAPQMDDITMMILRFYGEGKEKPDTVKR